MEIKYEDMLNLTWREFDYYSTGYFRRIERGWDYTRHLMATQHNASGFAKKTIKPKDMFPLPTIDKKVNSIVKRIDQRKLDKMIKILNRDGSNN